MPRKFKAHSRLSGPQLKAYEAAFHAALDLTVAASAKLRQLTLQADNLAQLSARRAQVFEAMRLTQLLQVHHRAFLRDEFEVGVPDPAEIRDIARKAERLNAAAATSANAQSIDRYLTQGLNAFGALHDY